MLHRNRLLLVYGLFVLLGFFLLTRLKFSFDFEQFFPKGDPDWAFFKDRLPGHSFRGRSGYRV